MPKDEKKTLSGLDALSDRSSSIEGCEKKQPGWDNGWDNGYEQAGLLQRSKCEIYTWLYCIKAAREALAQGLTEEKFATM